MAIVVTSVLLAIPCILWAVSQYHGALAASGGSRLKAWWCVLSNPLWYPFYLVLGREAGGAM